ncbi:MAG: PhzF family phenazine biosynthesis protein [Pseudomonadota bacterium]
MATYRYHTLDVFTGTRFAGNPLAVVLDAEGLSDALMQTIAKEFNYAETVFVTAAENPAHTAKVRIFTPQFEMPFAGHPTIGTAVLLAGLKTPEVNGERDAIIVLEEKIGNVRVGVRLRDGASDYAEFSAPQLPSPLDGVPSADALAAALGLIPSEIGFDNHQPLRVDAGNTWTIIPVATREALSKARPVQPYWDEAMAKAGDIGAYVYCRQPQHTTSSFQARMFAPGAGVPEDPATGSAAAAFPQMIATFDQPPDGTHKRIIEQGFQMGRPSLITVTMVVRGGAMSAVRIGGEAVHVMSGTLHV